MRVNELLAEIKALSENERDNIYRLLLADIEFRRALQAAAGQPVNNQPIPYGKPATSWLFPEALSLGQPNAPVENWRLLANEPCV